MSAPRRRFVCAVHPLAIAAALAANLAGAAWAQQPAVTDTSSATTTDQVVAPKALDSVTVSGARVVTPRSGTD